METKRLNHHTMFYEDQHKLAAYLERHDDKFEYTNVINGSPDQDGWVKSTADTTPTWYVKNGFLIRPVLRYGLPSHLQPYKDNPRDPGEGYRVPTGEDVVNLYECYYEKTGTWNTYKGDGKYSGMNLHYDFRLPADVPWPDWEQEEATQPDPKDARIAELEAQCSEYRDKSVNDEVFILQLQERLATSPWRRMSEVPTEEDRDKHGDVFGLHARHGICVLLATGLGLANWPGQDKDVLAWMPAPKFHGWPDPLADLLKQHGIEATPELTAALKAWKEVEK